MRGKALCSRFLHALSRITPAYAGKSLRSQIIWAKPKDHPCVCGEKLSLHGRPPSRQGSPLRMRGKAFCGLVMKIKSGITPASAGKSRQGRPYRLHLQDHPCVCGEKL